MAHKLCPHRAEDHRPHNLTIRSLARGVVVMPWSNDYSNMPPLREVACDGKAVS